MNKGQRIGYIRVSGPDQNPDRQLEGVQLDKKYIDYASGKSINRKEYQKMLGFVREGDIVIVHSIDRIARNLIDLRNIITSFNSKGIAIQFMKENLLFSPDNEDLRSTLTLNILGAVAEFELAIINERRREGIAAAKARGVHCGRSLKLTEEQQNEIDELISQKVRIDDIAKMYGVSRTLIYNFKNRNKK